MRLPDFAIIGAQKSATTFLQFCLVEHPEVFMPRAEIPFFESPDYEQSTIDDLAQLFAGKKEKRLGFKRPNYLGKIEVPDRLAHDLPEARLIVILRNPVDRAISAYYHYVAYGFIPALDIERGMRRLLHDPSFIKKYPRAQEIIDFGFFHQHLSRYEFFNRRNQLLLLLYEDIAIRVQESLKKVYDFLDIDPEFVPSSVSNRPQATTRDLRRLRLLRFRNRLLHDYDARYARLSAKDIGSIKKLFAVSLVGLDRFIFSKLPGTIKTPVSSELKASLYEMYADDLKALESYLGQNLSSWKPVLAGDSQQPGI